MKIKISDLEAKLNKKIKKNIQSIGLDIAERTGVCIITTDKTYIDLDWQFIEFDKSDINSVYENMFSEFLKIIVKDKKKNNVVIIEDSFLQRFGKFVQADVFKKLTRFGTIALVCSFLNKMSYHFILAKSARAKLKIKMIKGQPKESVAKYLKNELDIVVDDNDIADAIVLAILGIIEEMDFRSQASIDKLKKIEKKKAEKLAIKKLKKLRKRNEKNKS